MRRIIITGAILSLLLVGGSAGFSRGSKDPNETWTTISANFKPTVAIASGVINAVATVQDDVVMLPNGTFTNTAIQTYPDGTITLMDGGPEQSVFYPNACVDIVTFSAPFRVVGATGIYAGLTGSGTISGTVTIIFARTPTGCSQEPTQVTAIGPATGRVHLP